jgi:hypothetical protein
MRSLTSFVLALALAAPIALFALLSQAGVADAAFHCVRIHAVAGGVNGNNNIQYVELRMDLGGQNLVAGHTIQFFSSAGQLKATFTFPGNVTNAAAGDSILIATSEFNSSFIGGAADFTFTATNTAGINGGDPLHPVQVPGGLVVWAGPSAACVTVTAPVDALAYGAATAIYGTAATALPNPGTMQALRLNNLNITPANNSTEYALANISPTTHSVLPADLKADFDTPRNNARTVLTFLLLPSGVGGVAEAPALTAEAAVATQPANGAPSWLAVAATSAIAVCAAAAGGSWYAYRRRRP